MDNNDKRIARTFHLFAGAGGGLLGDILLGHIPVGACEISIPARTILLSRQLDGALPKIPIWDDIHTLDGAKWRGHVDILCGGFPCQAFSTAAHGKNIESKDLWGEMRRVTAEMQPRWVFAENVSKKAIDCARRDLETMGYTTRAVQISAADMGADHIRRRYWLLAHSNMYGKFCGPVNAEAQGVSGVRESVWSSKPTELRMADGMARGVDRKNASGNGQVPQVVEAALKFLSE